MIDKEKVQDLFEDISGLTAADKEALFIRLIRQNKADEDRIDAIKKYHNYILESYKKESARQEMAWIDPKYYSIDPRQAASEIWRDQLLPLGVKLVSEALKDISAGKISRTPQDKRFGTFEPSLDVKDIYRPDLLMLPHGGATVSKTAVKQS
jgi:hypothetical protein